MDRKDNKGYIGLVYVSFFEELLFLTYENNVCMLLSTHIKTSYIITYLYLFACSNQSCRLLQLGVL